VLEETDHIPLTETSWTTSFSYTRLICEVGLPKYMKFPVTLASCDRANLHRRAKYCMPLYSKFPPNTLPTRDGDALTNIPWRTSESNLLPKPTQSLRSFDQTAKRYACSVGEVTKLPNAMSSVPNYVTPRFVALKLPRTEVIDDVVAGNVSVLTCCTCW
jgi:hypothetical protein